MLVKDGKKLKDGTTLEDSGIHSNSKISINLEYRVRSPTLSLSIPQPGQRRAPGENRDATPRGAIGGADAGTEDAAAEDAAIIQNLAADPNAVLTASSSWEEGRSPREALPLENDFSHMPGECHIAFA